MKPTVTIGGRDIGDGAPLFLAVETGTTANGSLETALRLVDAAKAAGADAIKFMLIDPDAFMSDRTVTYEYEWAGGRRVENMYEMFQKLRFRPDEWQEIAGRCRERGIIFYATVDYLEGVELAERLDVPAYKLSSWDAGNLPLVREMARTGKPLQIDAGPITLAEIDRLLEFIDREGSDQAIIVHCTHATEDDQVNMRSVPYLKRTFHVPVGYSADSRDHVPDLIGLALGANLIEKRLTIDRTQQLHHHVKALEPAELREYVATIRRAERMLGAFAVRPSAEDRRQRELYFVSLVAAADIPAGTTLTPELLACKRPGTGIAPDLLPIVTGRATRRPLKENELLTWDAI